MIDSFWVILVGDEAKAELNLAALAEKQHPNKNAVMMNICLALKFVRF